jgi:hypothetical protein
MDSLSLWHIMQWVLAAVVILALLMYWFQGMDSLRRWYMIHDASKYVLIALFLFFFQPLLWSTAGWHTCNDDCSDTCCRESCVNTAEMKEMQELNEFRESSNGSSVGMTTKSSEQDEHGIVQPKKSKGIASKASSLMDKPTSDKQTSNAANAWHWMRHKQLRKVKTVRMKSNASASGDFSVGAQCIDQEDECCDSSPNCIVPTLLFTDLVIASISSAFVFYQFFDPWLHRQIHKQAILKQNEVAHSNTSSSASSKLLDDCHAGSCSAHG